ncbi:MAG: HEAT repeat domain-containing protein [Myxococcales bacterium]|nr:HEAT repeat domain-containing protein [Myxococcales bacterium]
MRSPPLRASLLALVAFALLAPGRVSAERVSVEPEGERWPVWPTEITRAAEPLIAAGDEPIPESQRLEALQNLRPFATPLVEKVILDALIDPSPALRREALQACSRREIKACVAPARTIWRGGGTDLSSRLYALRVILLEPTAAHVDLILAALRDPAEILRVEAARLLGATVLPDAEGPRVRAALVAKLADPAPEVRRAVAGALGLLGASEATLVLTRMLDDPDPQVRRDAAEALGMLDDPRALPTLIRAIERGDEVFVARALLDGLARHPGEEVDRRLLDLLDARPPRGLTSKTIAQAIGGRASVSPALLDGLLLRLREPSLLDNALDALLRLGDQAVAAIEGRSPAGSSPRWPSSSSASSPPAACRARPRPRRSGRRPTTIAAAGSAPSIAAAWTSASLAAAALAERAPGWLGAAIGGALARVEPGGARPWLLALARMPGPPRDLLLWARVQAIAEDPGLPIDLRGLAIAALGRAPARALARLGDALDHLAGDSSAGIRSAVALARAGDPEALPLLDALLGDPSPRVRAAAALALKLRPARLKSPITARLALMALDDEDGRVRAIAAWAGEATPSTSKPPALARRQADTAGEDGWMAVEGPLLVPALSGGGLTWALLPAPGLAAVEAPALGGRESSEWLE